MIYFTFINHSYSICRSNISITFKGYDGRVVNIYKVPTNTSHEDLLEYKNLETLESSEIDKECCWGIAYKVNIYSWEHDGIRVKVEDNNPDGFVPTKMTFYPVVNIKCPLNEPF